MRVLLIEDDSATAQSIELMLKSESFNVYTTDLGEEGIDLGKIYDYDIILLDLNCRTCRASKFAQPARVEGQDPDPDPLRIGRHRGQGQGARLRRRRLHDQAVPQGRAGGAHPRHRTPRQVSRSINHPDRRSCRQHRYQDRRDQWHARASDWQGVPDVSARRRAMRFDMCRANYLAICRSSNPNPNKPTEQIFPNAASCPSHEAVTDRCRRTMGFGTIAPAVPLLSICTI